MGVTTYPDAVIPAGFLMPSARGDEPPGWLLCNGTTKLRTDYPDLFTAIGTQYNTGGEAGTEFRLPDLKGRTIVMQDPAQVEFDDLGESGGTKTHTLIAAEMPQHNHSVTVTANNFTTGDDSPDHAHYVPDPGRDYTYWMDRNVSHSHGLPSALNAGGNIGLAPGGSNYNLNHYWAGTHGTDTNHLHHMAHNHGNSWGATARHRHNANHGHTASSGNAGSSGAHNNLQPYIALNYLIKT